MTPDTLSFRAQKKHFLFKIILVILLTALLMAGIYIVPKVILKANLMEDTAIGTGEIYISTHSGKGEGTFKVRAKKDIAFFDSIAFDLNFPSNTLIFPQDAIVLDQDTLLQPEDIALKLSRSTQDKMILTLILSQPFSVNGLKQEDKNTHPILFKLAAQTGENLAPEQVLGLEIENFSLLLEKNNLNLSMSAESLIFKETQALDSIDPLASSNDGLDVHTQSSLETSSRILEEKAYTSPRFLVNDGKTPGTLYVPIQDPEGDIAQVMVDLSTVGGQEGPQNSSDFNEIGAEASSAPEDCVGGSLQKLCMQLAFREDETYWYILKNVTFSKNTLARTEPYFIEVILSDSLDQKESQLIPILVGDGSASQTHEPHLKAQVAVPTTATSLEVVFNQDLDAEGLKTDLFEIMDINQAENTLSIDEFNPPSNLRIVTLKTAEQPPQQSYVLKLKEGLKDSLGQGLMPEAENQLAFKGFYALNQAPDITFAQVADDKHFHLEFNTALKPSTLPIGGPDYKQIKIYEAGSLSPLSVLGLNMLSEKTLEIMTETQDSGASYMVEMTGIHSFDGISSPLIQKTISGSDSLSSAWSSLAQAADLNKDGVVNFDDFTLFSSVYGATYTAPPTSFDAPATTLNVIGDPDPSIPTTSVPAGGTILLNP